MSSDVKESEIEVYDSQDDTRPEYGSLWDDDHLNMLLDHGPEGAFDEMLAKYAASGEVLVLGCGEGKTVEKLAMNDNSRSVYGIEISNTRLKSASENSCKNSFFLRADAEQLPFCNNSFDVIVAHSVLHHLPQLDSNGLAEIQRVLTADGSLLFYEPGRFNPPAAIRRSLLPSNIHTPDEQPFDPSELEAKLLQSFGYVDIDGHILFSSLLPVMQKQVPVDIPHILTRALYNIEKKLLSSVTNRLAWILTGMAKQPKK